MNRKVVILITMCLAQYVHASNLQIGDGGKESFSGAAEWVADSVKQLWKSHSVAFSAAAMVTAVGGCVVIVPRFFHQVEKRESNPEVSSRSNVPAVVSYHGNEELEEAQDAPAAQEVSLRSHEQVTLLKGIQKQETRLECIQNENIAYRFEKLLVLLKILGAANEYDKSGYPRLTYSGSCGGKNGAICWVRFGREVPFHVFLRIDSREAEAFCENMNKEMLDEQRSKVFPSDQRVQTFMQSFLQEGLSAEEKLTKMLFKEMGKTASYDKRIRAHG